MARVLIVEDEEQVRVLAESYLREQGHHTLSAATPVEALAALDVADGVDVLFVDIGIHEHPHAGLDLAKEARQRKPDLKVLELLTYKPELPPDSVDSVMGEGVVRLRRACNGTHFRSSRFSTQFVKRHTCPKWEVRTTPKECDPFAL
jgi:CheY-like chemotaxis protein